MDQFFIGILVGSLIVLFFLLLHKFSHRRHTTQMNTMITPMRPASPRRYWIAQDLTPREMQVARLVASGLSNAEVARQLDLKPRTIDSHLRIIYQKLNVNSRTQLANVIRDVVD